VSAVHGMGTSDVSAPGLNFGLTRLVAGKVDAIAFVEVGPDAVAVQVLGADADGVPVIRPEAGHSVPWTAILPELPVTDILRYELMAGPIDAIPGGDSVTAAVEHKLELLKEMAAMDGRSSGTRWRLDIVLVKRTYPWPLLHAATARARAVLRPITEVTATSRADALPKLIGALAAQAPLRYGYDLVVAEVDPTTRAVSPQTRQLFPAGTSVLGASSETKITVSPVTGHTARALALPIVARRGPVSDLRDVGALAEHRPKIKMIGLDARVSGPVELHVRLTRPGCLDITLPQRARLTTAGEPGWPELIKELPHRLPPKNMPWLLSPPGYLDLAVLIELGGTEADVSARVRLARDLVRRFQGVRDAAIAAVGYRDHDTGFDATANWVRGREAEALMVGCRQLTTQAEAASMLAMPGWWDAAPVDRPHAAPLEHALALLADAERGVREAQRAWGWRPRARHVVVVIGSRPPHPVRSREAERYNPVPNVCRYGCRWRYALDRLQEMHQVDRYTVLDKSPGLGYDVDAWREFGARECFRLGRVSLRRVAEACGLVAPPRTQIRLAMLRAASPSATGAPSGRAVP
jgi:hypothetical protein